MRLLYELKWSIFHIGFSLFCILEYLEAKSQVVRVRHVVAFHAKVTLEAGSYDRYS